VLSAVKGARFQSLHRSRSVIPAQAPLAERQRDTARADAELESAPVARQVGQEIHDGVDNLWLEQSAP
jgi:hypothetical protein